MDMTIRLQNFWQTLIGKRLSTSEEVSDQPTHNQKTPSSISIAPNDPIVNYFLKAAGAVEIERIDLQSPALAEMRQAGIKLVVPLVGQGELIGVLMLGPRLSEQEYSTDDRGLLSNLATQAAPALRVAQLVRQQKAEVQARARMEQELRVARLIQQTLLPQELPELPGWKVAAHYQPARAVGGDFYDFLYLPDGRLGLVIGDVTDKGVPAALVMATTRSVLRSAAENFTEPGQVLERANNLLCPDIPQNMFVTCLYAILEPASGHLVFANAGHDLPFRRCENDVEELRATGMPLGLLPGMHYEQAETTLQPGESVLFYSDGLVEAHAPHGEMFGFPRLQALIGEHPGGEDLIGFLLDQLARFTEPGWEQEDDVTFLTLQRMEEIVPKVDLNSHTLEERYQSVLPGTGSEKPVALTELAAFQVPSQPGNERQVIAQVAEALANRNIPELRLERLKTAVGEAAMNAMEHGNHYQAEIPVQVKVLAGDSRLVVRITDQGSGQHIPTPEVPDLEAKLAGRQTPRGWGLFLIKNMVDELNVIEDDTHHTVELIFNQEDMA